MDGQQYYNYTNLEQYCKKVGIEMPNSKYIKWVKDIINTKMGMFSYEGLPNNITSQILEQALIFNSHLCFYNKKALGGWVLCRWIPNGKFNIYWKPTKVQLLALNGETIETSVPYEDIILVRDNTLDIPPFLTLNTHIDEIITMEKTLDVVTKWLRFPVIIEGDKSEVVALEKLIQKNLDSEAYAIATKNFTDNRFKDIKIDIPVSPKEIFELIEKKRNLALASMGIYATDNKRERQITSEIQAENDYVDFVYSNMYEERKHFVEELNKRGLKIKLIETYVENKLDDIETERIKTKSIEQEKAKAQIMVEKVKEEDKDNGEL